MSEYIYATNGELVANIDGDISLAREEIVRCRDCKHMHTVSGWFGTYVDKCYLPDPETGEILDRNIKNLDGFCAWGVRRENV